MSDVFTAPRLSLQDLSVAAGPQTGLEKISFDLHPGEILAVLGENGAGKAALVRVLAGLRHPDGGKIVWYGKPVALGPPLAAISLGISTVWQAHALYPGLPVWRSLFLLHEDRIGRRIGPVLVLKKRQAREQSRTILAAAGIDGGDVDQPVSALSWAQQRALAIARAVYFKSSLLVLENVTSAVPEPEADRLLKQIDAARKTGMSVIFCTGHAEQAAQVCDQFVLLHKGRIQATGDKPEPADFKPCRAASPSPADAEIRRKTAASQAS
ncbi:Ribose import ATP-binding protein RbsA [Thalassovita gelatinovora]|uniref:Ribose import ATP-binding protein RbsA n=1 Tax=Thalassovita gelatinovora TaxID=53501 RepID=A0A0P1FAJ7_THAGE|nr:ATP-binding cassette domain-containing protein [Thalassovita gelatinovora]QIZ80646.1 sugar ABC transporter ATP-binding protein [Thalassovita gelatinovora]CUH65204.1 Ribose import ATP-binding protein RbsA [Thalassovita gelatinovora]SEQ87419.1 simple sugar transport system ATP-binding protein [Thalassovita gelatinovora]